MGNHNRPKIDQDDIELMKKIGRHNFVDMLYVYRFYKVDCKKRTVNDRINQLANHNYLNVIKTFVPPEYTACLLYTSRKQKVLEKIPKALM